MASKPSYPVYGADALSFEAVDAVYQHVSASVIDPRTLDCVTHKGDHLELAFKSGITRRLPLPE
jgi:hypothetical protein